MLRQARMQDYWMRHSILSFAAMTAMFVFANGIAEAAPQFDSALVLGKSMPEGLTDRVDGLFPLQAAGSSEPVAQIHQQPAPHVPAEMLTEPTDTPDSALPIPEPTSLALLGGLGGMMMLIYRMRAYFDLRVTK